MLAFIRRYEDERILVVANLSRFVQGVELDLSEFQGMVPVEMFGRIEFPPVGDEPYFLTLGPHSFYWFSLEAVRPDLEAVEVLPDGIPTLVAAGDWEDLFEEEPDRPVSHAICRASSAASAGSPARPRPCAR